MFGKTFITQLRNCVMLVTPLLHRFDCNVHHSSILLDSQLILFDNIKVQTTFTLPLKGSVRLLLAGEMRKIHDVQFHGDHGLNATQ